MLITTALFALAYYLKDAVGLAQIFTSETVRFSLITVFFLAGSALLGWSLYLLPPKERGRNLVTGGAFKYCRHPLYATFLLFFSFGLAFLLNHWVYIIMVVSIVSHLVT